VPVLCLVSNMHLLRATATAAVARLSHCSSVRLSLGWISQKRCKLESPNLHRRLPGRPSFRISKAFSINSKGPPPARVLNEKGVGKM